MRRFLGFFIISIIITAIIFTFSSNIQATYNIEDNLIPQSNIEVDEPSSTATPTSGDSDFDYDDDYEIFISDAVNGVVTVNINIDTDKVLKVKSSLDGNKTYYDVDDSRELKIPLQMGDGNYEISVFINKSGSEYIKLDSKQVEMNTSNSNMTFLSSNQIVNFEDSKNIKTIANNIIDERSEMQTIDGIYEFVIENLEYDYTKAQNISSKYVPDVDDVLTSKKGICYDYAAVTASLLRCAGIPTKLSMGYRSDNNVYHAWNEVYIDGEWVIIDTTWDSVQLSNGKRVNMIKDSSLYTTEQQF